MHRKLPPTLRHLALLGVALAPSLAVAKPTANTPLCDAYPTAPACAGQLPSCSTCHTSTDPAQWNEFGRDVRAALTGDFDATLGDALAAIEVDDSDGDGIANGAEIASGTNPGESDSCDLAEPVSTFSGYDFDLARRRVGVLYCGIAPTRDELDAFFDGASDEATLRARLHEALDACLASNFWRDRGLPELAHELIRPVYPVGHETPAAVSINLGDYKWDYRLFSYVLTGDRDARELLTAQYHVDEEFQAVSGVIGSSTATSGTQALVPERRAGMITTEWFLLINTMFSDLPRTTAAHAYRSYLGLDLSLQEGILPIVGEPVDVDDKGVDAAACAQCHSTLDPLAYAFAPYEGIAGSDTGTFDPGRPTRLMKDWDDNASYLFGEEVPDLVTWAKTAANSDAFKRTLATMFFHHATGRHPGPADEPELASLFTGLPEHGYSANRLIHDLIDTSTFGGLR
jgi:hypothetical protein